MFMTQKKKRKWDSIKRKWADEVEEEEMLVQIATGLFKPAGKNPYYLIRGTDCSIINNLAELKDKVDLFTEGEAQWVASWIEYLGDKKTAERIRGTPSEFKRFIIERYEELSAFR